MDTGVVVVLDMPFFLLNNVGILFAKKEFTWRSYTIAKVLPATKKVELIDKNKFAKVALDENIEAFVVHVASIESISIYLDREA